MDVVGRDGIGSGVGELAHGAGDKAYSLPRQFNHARQLSQTLDDHAAHLSRLAADRLHPAQNTLQVSRSYLRDIALGKPGRTSSAKRCRNRLTFSSPLEETRPKQSERMMGRRHAWPQAGLSKPRSQTCAHSEMLGAMLQASSQTLSLSSSKTRVGPASAIRQARCSISCSSWSGPSRRSRRRREPLLRLKATSMLKHAGKQGPSVDAFASLQGRDQAPVRSPRK